MNLYDPVRKKWVADTPEERVRQALLGRMVETLGYPLSLLAVEKELSSLEESAPSGRRADIVCFYPEKETLLPLLIVECKAAALDERAKNQALGYNFSLCAPFFSLAGPSEVWTFWNGGSAPFLPYFREMVDAVS